MERVGNADNSQGYIDLMVGQALKEGLVLKLRNLEGAQKKPYFARIDFTEAGKKKPEKLYIGKLSLTREEDQQPIIIDWRAPISNLYYESRLGPASYHCPEGEIGGDLQLKRQFSIEEGILERIFDIDITTNDQFLQSSLGANAADRLKDIAATIQAEQNRIIRADLEQPLIVQGAAGSGKTTIALHRIAYLIYTYNRSFRPEQFMIIAPNRLFLNYISEVLPELGVERVKQSTFEDFAMEVIGERFRLTDSHAKLIAFVDPEATPEQAARNSLAKQASVFKGSLHLKEFLDRYVAEIEQTLLPEEDFHYDRWVLCSREEIRHLYYDDYRDWPAFQRITQVKKHLAKRLKDRLGALGAQLQEECDRRVLELKLRNPESEERRSLIVATIDQKNERLDGLKSFAANGVKKYFASVTGRSAHDYYREFMAQPELFRGYAVGSLGDEVIDFIVTETVGGLDRKRPELEDLAPILYLKYCLYGLDERIRVKHIVIDEAQDFSIFQLYSLRQMIKDSTFTIFGDLAQGIHSYRAIPDWESVRDQVFAGKAEILTLEQSYRTTVEIMAAANRVIAHWKNAGIKPARPVIRHGPKVRLESGKDLTAIAATIAKELQALQGQDYRSFALIAKTAAECSALSKKLADSPFHPKVLTGKESEYHSGLVIVPSYLAKGLEFDVVMLVNVSTARYRENELDIKLLYVAMTRALHRLYLYYTGELSPLLKEVAGAV